MYMFSRNMDIDFLRRMSTPDLPTLIPQVVPNKEQQIHQQSDLKSLLKKPYVFNMTLCNIFISWDLN